jgi:multicomponent Na+:H+ antiporter subunit D
MLRPTLPIATRRTALRRSIVPDLHPALVLVVGALLVAVVPRRFGGAVSVGAALVALAAVVGLDDGATWAYDFYGYELTLLRADGLSLAFATLFAIITVLAAIYGWATMGTLERCAALATAGAGIGVVLAGDLLTLFFFWEFKVTTAVLLIFARRRARAAASGMRYLQAHLVGGVLLLAGVLWRLAETGSLAFDSFELTGATSLVLVGILLSAAAVPLNAWLPDSYPESTVAGTVVLSAFTTKSAVYALARGFPGLELLVWLGVTMAIFGVVYAILEDDIRRLLGYHIVSQVGFMVAAIGVGTEAAVNGATAHATAHILYKGLLLMGAGAVLYATGRSRTSELGGLARALPVVLVLYLVGAASISGIPLFSGFAAKELSFDAMAAGGYGTAQWLLKVASVGTFLSVALKLPALTWFGESRAPASPGGAPAPRRPVPVTMYVAMGLTAAANVAIGLQPRLLYDLMPAEVVFQPYTTGKVVETLMLVSFTTIGFVLLRSRLQPKARVSLDTDWFVRELPVRMAPAVSAGWDRLRPGDRRRRVFADLPSSWSGAWSDAAAWLRRGAGGPVAPGWMLGSAIVAAMVLVLAVSVIP